MVKQYISRLAVTALALSFVLSCKGEKCDHHSGDLHTAAANGDFEEVECLISEGLDVNDKKPDGSTPLHMAAWAGQGIAITSELAPKGGSGHGVEKFEGHKAVAEILVKNGADVNAKDRVNGTPLHFAAFHGNLLVARILIESGADVNARRNDGATPLSLSVASGHTNMTEFLKHHGGHFESAVTSSGQPRQTPDHRRTGFDEFSVDTMRIEMKNCEREYDPALCEKVIVYFDRMLESGEGTDKQKASAHAARARILSNSYKQHRKAILDYEKAISLNPYSAEFLFNRGNTYLRLKETNLAITDYNRAIEIEPNNLDIRGSRGWAYHMAHRNDLALKDYDHILEIRPSDLRALINRAVIHKDLGNRSKAISDLKRAYRIQPGNPHIISELEDLGG